MTLLTGRVSMAEWNTFCALYEEEKETDFDITTTGGQEYEDVGLTKAVDGDEVDEEGEDEDEEEARSMYAGQEAKMTKEARKKKGKTK